MLCMFVAIVVYLESCDSTCRFNVYYRSLADIVEDYRTLSRIVYLKLCDRTCRFNVYYRSLADIVEYYRTLSRIVYLLAAPFSTVIT